ncbi:MAG: DUF2071 domain-containing protein [Cyanobacteria bacterium]|nr:DUF2071 domain-containing protein [Cyanobacteriota bacterium]
MNSFYPVMHQTWEHLLFAHWPIAPEVIQEKLPQGLDVDVYDNTAWLAVVPFQLSFMVNGLHLTGVKICFTELNLRTYVKHQGRRGVYFFCLDASDWFSVEMARCFFHLNYFNANSSLVPIKRNTGQTVEGSHFPSFYFQSQRKDKRGNPTGIHIQYGPTGPVQRSVPGSLVHFLTEQYRLFSVDANGIIRTAQIDHEPWPLQPAAAFFSNDKLSPSITSPDLSEPSLFGEEKTPYSELSLPQAHGFILPNSEPLLHYSERVHVQNSWIQRT